MIVFALVELFDCDPLCAGGEEFFHGVDGYDVRAQSADAAVGAEGDSGHEAGVVFV